MFFKLLSGSVLVGLELKLEFEFTSQFLFVITQILHKICNGIPRLNCEILAKKKKKTVLKNSWGATWRIQLIGLGAKKEKKNGLVWFGLDFCRIEKLVQFAGWENF